MQAAGNRIAGQFACTRSPIACCRNTAEPGTRQGRQQGGRGALPPRRAAIQTPAAQSSATHRRAKPDLAAQQLGEMA